MEKSNGELQTSNFQQDETIWYFVLITNLLSD